MSVRGSFDSRIWATPEVWSVAVRVRYTAVVCVWAAPPLISNDPSGAFVSSTIVADAVFESAPDAADT